MNRSSVLVVEDNDLERSITADTLSEEGFIVEQAPSGKRALEFLALSRFDVVLTDLMMPGMTGEELLARIRPVYPATQVVVLTAHGTIESAVQAMKSGAFYYLTKPTDRETLVMTIERAAEVAALRQENILLKTELAGGLTLEGIVGARPRDGRRHPDRAERSRRRIRPPSSRERAAPARKSSHAASTSFRRAPRARSSPSTAPRFPRP